MILKLLTCLLATSAILLPASSSKAVAQTGMHEAGFEDAVSIGRLRGPFRYGLDWSQYLDRQAEDLEIVSGGRSFSWKDIFSRISFFKLRNARRYDGSVIRPEFLDYSSTSVRFFKDDRGTIYAAGWRHLLGEEKSVFSIAPVNLSLLSQFSGQRRWDRKILDTLAEDSGLSIVFQPYTEDGNAHNSGYENYSDSKRSDLLPYLENRTKPLSDWFLEDFDPSDYSVDGEFAAYVANDGCDVTQFGSEFFSEGYMLSPLGRCVFDNVVTSQVYHTTDSLDVWKDAQEKFLRDNKVTVSGSGSIPDINDIPEVYRFGHRWNYFPFSMYSWSSLSRSACDIRTPESEDWIILRFDDQGPGAFSAYSDKDVKYFADRIQRNTDLGAGGKYPCDGVPNSLTIRVYHEEKIIAEQRVSGSQVPDRLSKKFLDEGIGKKILNYSKEF